MMGLSTPNQHKKYQEFKQTKSPRIHQNDMTVPELTNLLFICSPRLCRKGSRRLTTNILSDPFSIFVIVIAKNGSHVMERKIIENVVSAPKRCECTCSWGWGARSGGET